MSDDILKRLKACRRCKVPVVVYTTPDQSASIEMICGGINGETPKLKWDFCSGLVPINEQGKQVLIQAEIDVDDTAANPAGVVQEAIRFSANSQAMLFVKNAQRFIDDIGFVQAVANCKDAFRGDEGEAGRMLMLMGPAIEIPREIANDVVVIDEPLPEADRAKAIIDDVYKGSGVSAEVPDMAVAAVQGMPAFQIEQEVALSLTRQGVDVDELWEAKRKAISQTRGLSVTREGFTLDQMGGLQQIKAHLARVMKGRRRPNAVVWLDEGDDAMAGKDDMTGITKDQQSLLLKSMEQSRARGFILYGHPGSGKSCIAVATGVTFGVPVIECDLGAMMGSLVGESQQNIRAAIKVIDAISGGNALWLMTANSLGNLPPQLQARFSCGTYFFDLPTDEEKDVIWDIKRKEYGLEEDETFRDVDTGGWVGRDIRNCCESAWDDACSIADAAVFINPIARACPKDIELRRNDADGKCLDASSSGVYRKSLETPVAQRRVAL